ncbi:hypothetical protein [Bradyrhizobium prioriisuperbiae]|uniref:hypothetical protein n=1 Tax=Bradyrhizobium prioriisuperbiae TaxID=2854389 RepID=UPI0028E89BCA|nr:hypothetical protein [Bradyrhizobium prioritasuperba]
MADVKLIRHAESYEVRLADGTSKYWYYDDDDPIRRVLMGRMTGKEAEEAAKAFARLARDGKTDG